MQEGRTYTLVDFDRDNPSYDEFTDYLRTDRDITRGLPKDPALYASVMRKLLVEQAIECSGQNLSENYCSQLEDSYKHGYINREARGESFQSRDYYVFVSPLHMHLWSRLLVALDGPGLQCQDLFTLVKNVISHFRPSQLTELNRRGGAPQHRPPEAQYQAEFYRCIHEYTNGGVVISPEYAAAAGARPGRIDFFLSSKKWGIELTRDGSRLGEHHSRFQEDGSYAEWLKSSKMSDYIFLDFRLNKPQQPHPGKTLLLQRLS